MEEVGDIQLKQAGKRPAMFNGGPLNGLLVLVAGLFSALYLLYTVVGITQRPLFIRLRGNFIPLYHYFFFY